MASSWYVSWCSKRQFAKAMETQSRDGIKDSVASSDKDDKKAKITFIDLHSSYGRPIVADLYAWKNNHTVRF